MCSLENKASSSGPNPALQGQPQLSKANPSATQSHLNPIAAHSSRSPLSLSTEIQYMGRTCNKKMKFCLFSWQEFGLNPSLLERQSVTLSVLFLPSFNYFSNLNENQEKGLGHYHSIFGQMYPGQKCNSKTRHCVMNYNQNTVLPIFLRTWTGFHQYKKKIRFFPSQKTCLRKSLQRASRRMSCHCRCFVSKGKYPLCFGFISTNTVRKP